MPTYAGRVVVAGWLLILVAGARPRAQGTRPADVLTLESAVASALENNRLLKNAELEAAKAELQVASARTQRLPHFSLNAYELQLLAPFDFRFDTGIFGSFPATGPIPPADTKIVTPRQPNTVILFNAVQPLTQLRRASIGVKLSEAGRDIARERVRAQRQSLTQDVRKLYYGLLQARDGLDATDGALKLFAELDRVVGEYVLQRVALRADALEVKRRLAKTEYDALTIRNTSASLKEQLNLLLGRDPDIDFTVAPLPDVAPRQFNLEASRARALAERPEVKEARLKATQAEYDYRLKQAERLPEVNVFFTQLSLFNVVVFPRNGTVVGGSVTWEPFDWGRTKNELAEKSRTMEQAANGVREAEAMIRIDVSNRYRKLLETQAQLRVANAAQAEQGERLRVATDKLKEQSALLKDVLQVQVGLAEANYQYAQALMAFWTARAEFEKALGEE